MDADDKRGDARVPFVLRVHFQDRAAALNATENLSRGGIFVQTNETLRLGEHISLAVSFPGLLEPVALSGEVVWVRRPRADAVGGAGIRVADRADRDRLAMMLGEGKAGRAAPTVSGYRVLLVEDNPHVVEMYSYVLKKLAAEELGRVPMQVHFAQDGHGALAQLQGPAFHLVVTDLYMPVLDGFVLVQRMKADPRLRSVPVVAISGGGPEAQERATHLGVDVYLGKPVKFVQVLETVKRLLRIS